MKNVSLISIGLMVLIGCGTPAKNETGQTTEVATAGLTDHPGYKLYQMYCIACHGGTQEPAQRLAPPAFMVQKHYKDAFQEEEFKRRIVSWVNSPAKDKSIMPGAVRNFDVMPPLQLSLEDRQLIADYFWQTSFAEPAWAATHMQQEQQKRQQMTTPSAGQ